MTLRYISEMAPQHPDHPKPPPCRVIKEDVDFLFLPRLLKAIFNVLFKSEKRIKDYPKFGSDLQ